MLRAPGQLGLGRAYVAGALDVDDVDKVLALLDGYSPAADRRARQGAGWPPRRVRAGALKEVPKTPAVELRPQGRRHSIARDKRAVTHHYDVSNDFFALFLERVDDVLVRGLVARRRDARGGAGGQARARLHQARACSEGERVLDVGCGWGAFAVHAASATASTSPASRCRSRRPRERGERAPRTRASATASTSA